MSDRIIDRGDNLLRFQERVMEFALILRRHELRDGTDPHRRNAESEWGYCGKGGYARCGCYHFSDSCELKPAMDDADDSRNQQPIRWIQWHRRFPSDLGCHEPGEVEIEQEIIDRV